MKRNNIYSETMNSGKIYKQLRRKANNILKKKIIMKLSGEIDELCEQSGTRKYRAAVSRMTKEFQPKSKGCIGAVSYTHLLVRYIYRAVRVITCTFK